MSIAFNKILQDEKNTILISSPNTMVVLSSNNKSIFKSFGKVIAMSQISKKEKDSFEVDRNRTIKNYEQLKLLERLQVNTPNKLAISEDNSFLTMEIIEYPTLLNKIIYKQIDEKLFQKLGEELEDIHKKLNSGLVTNTLIKSFEIDDRFNAHCAKNFKNKTSGWLTKDGGRSLNGSNLEQLFVECIKKALLILDANSQYLTEESVIFGDFKPDNIFITDIHNIYSDPLLTYGRFSCDIGKFGSRLFMHDIKVFERYFPVFREAYFQKSTSEANLIEIKHMIAFDILNYFSKELLMFHKGIIPSKSIEKYEEILQNSLSILLK